ncbi:hypothetical protein IGI04_014918 [Brassica rapa subsp. trilocularis]|uniref:RRM domain-containing protein n=1 Tax=Brassica rapa subsp. trilocularis TaxID=1813537 RepID=A0ABQ7MRM6_BRACM|nr:hypothetical protein IGI04_014918 [Brassica rapa subsp. trilocularis]
MRRVTGSRGFGYISYDSLDASDAATEAMTGQYLYNCHAYNKDTKGEQQEEKIELQWNNFGLKGQEPREIVAEAAMEEGNCELEFGLDNYKKLNKSFHLSRILKWLRRKQEQRNKIKLEKKKMHTPR